MITPYVIPMHNIGTIECAWYDAHSQAVLGSMVVAKSELMKTCGNGGSKLAVGDAVYLAAADVVCDLGNSSGLTEWDLQLGLQVIEGPSKFCTP